MSESGGLTLDGILNSPVSTISDRSTAQALDQLIDSSSSAPQRIADWNRVAAALESKGVSSGHAHFRLGILHLVIHPDEAAGISHLERAYEQDQKFGAHKEPHRLA